MLSDLGENQDGCAGLQPSTLLLLKTRYPVLDRPGKFAALRRGDYSPSGRQWVFSALSGTKIDDRFKAQERNAG